jgi:hypothetical protein
MKKILILGVLALVGCSPKTTVEIWQDNQGNAVPVNVTYDGQDTVYNFGTIILYPDTTYGGDTIK